MKSFTVVFNPSGEELILVHATGCKDLAKAEVLYKRGVYSHVGEVKAESAKAALEAELSENFSGGSEETGWEHPPAGGYPGGTYGAAGFTGRILPCCKSAKEVA